LPLLGFLSGILLSRRTRRSLLVRLQRWLVEMHPTGRGILKRSAIKRCNELAGLQVHSPAKAFERVSSPTMHFSVDFEMRTAAVGD